MIGHHGGSDLVISTILMKTVRMGFVIGQSIPISIFKVILVVGLFEVDVRPLVNLLETECKIIYRYETNG